MCVFPHRMPSCLGVRFGTLVFLSVGLAFSLAPVGVVQAASILVTTTRDELNTDGDCSLREAIRAANTNTAVDRCPAGSSATDSVTLPAGTYTLTRSGANEDAALTGDLDITSDLILTGADAVTTIIDGNRLDRVFQIWDVTVTLAQLTIRNGFARSSGGGILSDSESRLTMTNTAISSNSADVDGGGIANLGELTLTNSTISGNIAERGGGIKAFSRSELTLTNSTITGNTAEHGAGIQNDGTLMVANSTISGNSAVTSGAGISHPQGTANLNNVSITRNIADSDRDGIGAGGGVDTGPLGTLTIQNTIIGMNVATSGQKPDCRGTLTSQGYNLIQNTSGCTITGDPTGNKLGVDPKLGPLQNNGGPTFTHRLELSSPAIDAANPATPGSGRTSCEAADQRDLPRPEDGNDDGAARCDMGAYERAGNRLANPSFELDANGDGRPDGWTNDSRFTRSTAVPPHHGTYSGRLHATANPDVTIAQTVPNFLAGATYFAKCWVQIPPTSDSFTFRMELRWRDTANTTLRTDTLKTYSAATSGWNRVSGSRVAPSDTANVQMRLVATSLNATVYIDDCTIERGAAVGG